MIANKWFKKSMVKIAEVKEELDSAAAINGARMTESERQELKDKLDEILGLMTSMPKRISKQK